MATGGRVLDAGGGLYRGFVDRKPPVLYWMSAAFNEQHLGLTTIGVGSDVNAQLLRTLAEGGAGNFYFIEQPSAA